MLTLFFLFFCVFFSLCTVYIYFFFSSSFIWRCTKHVMLQCTLKYTLLLLYLCRLNLIFSVTGTVGLHGYDNTESSMYPFFLAHGPLLKKNTRVPVFDNIDLYSLWCHMLKLSPVSQQGIQQSRGDFSHVRGMLIADQHSMASLIAAGLYLQQDI